MSRKGDMYLRIKKKQKVMPLVEKVEMSDKMDRGTRATVVRHHYGGNESKFVLSISGETRVPSSAKISCVSHHNPFLQKMGSALCVQLEDEA
jgi:hypothetical protein